MGRPKTPGAGCLNVNNSGGRNEDGKMSNEIVVRVNGWDLVSESGKVEEARIVDTDLAGRLEISEPRMIRRIIKRLVDDGYLPGIHMRSRNERIEMKPVYRSVDDAIRREVGYPNEKGAKWELCDVERGTRAFSRIGMMSHSVSTALNKKRAAEKKAAAEKQIEMFCKAVQEA